MFKLRGLTFERILVTIDIVMIDLDRRISEMTEKATGTMRVVYHDPIVDKDLNFNIAYVIHDDKTIYDAIYLDLDTKKEYVGPRKRLIANLVDRVRNPGAYANDSNEWDFTVEEHRAIS